MTPLLSVQGLRTEFHADGRAVRAVDGLSYDLAPGRTVAVVGESGSGKSVHALSMLRLLPAQARITAGKVLFQGRDLLAASEDELRDVRGNRIAMIFQEPMTSLNPVLTIGDQIAEAVIRHRGASRKAAMDKAAALLAKVGVPEASSRLGDYPHQFSGGMRQRAMIAMALSCEPEVLIADEPTTALDVTIQAQILELISSLQKELKMAMILITHNLGVVAGMADDVVVMYAGRAVEKGPVDAVFERPLHPYTRGLLGSVPSVFARKQRLAAIKGHPPVLDRPAACCPFSPRCPDVMDICKAEDPGYYEPAPGRIANCFLHKPS